jgi:hypothetical protein
MADKAAKMVSTMRRRWGPRARHDSNAPQVLEGMDATEAWKRCGEPGTVNNIQKRVRLAKSKQQEQLDTTRRGLHLNLSRRPQTTAPKPRKKKQRRWRRTPHQVDMDRQDEKECADAHKDAVKTATSEYSLLMKTSGGNSGNGGAQGIVDRINAQLPPGAKQLTARYVKDQVKADRIGVSPLKKGPAPKIPAELIKATATYAQVRQLAGAEAKPKDLKLVMAAAAKGTGFEGALTSSRQKRKAYDRVLTENTNLERKGKCAVDARRWFWMTYKNLDAWFDGWRSGLVDNGFGFERGDGPRPADDDGLGELYIPDYARRRMLNIDEKHERLSNEGDRSGPRASSVVDRSLPRSGKPKYKSAGHVTGFYGSTAFGEPLPPLFIFDSAASTDEGRRLNSAWAIDLPKVNGVFGGDLVKTWDSFLASAPNGSTDDAIFEQFIDVVITPLYPNLAPEWKFADDGSLIEGPILIKTDGGPGRLGKTSLPARRRWAAMGIILFPGLQNTTAASQEQDELYGPFETKIRELTDEVIQEKMKANRQELEARKKDPEKEVTTVVGLTKYDLGSAIPRTI